MSFIFMIILVCPMFSHAQDLKFDNLVLISGVDLQIGAVYRQTLAAAGIDAEITIVDLTGGTTLQVFDDNGTAEMDAFQPRVIKTATLVDEYARFQIDFFVSATSTPVSVINASVSGVDIDGCCVLKEYVAFYGATSYTLENPTALTATQNGDTVRFEGPAGGPPGIDYARTDYIGNVEFASTNSFVFDIGAVDMGTFPVRQASIYFKSITFTSPTTSPTTEVGLCGNLIDDDGDGLVDCADSSDCVPNIPGAISLSNDTICEDISGENYSVTAVPGATSYDWTVPAGATLTAGQGTTAISVDWGSTSGNVCVRSYNGFCYSDFSCSVITVNSPPPMPSGIVH